MTILAVTRAARSAMLRAEAQAALHLRLLHTQAVRGITSGVVALQKDMQAAALANDGTIPLAFAQHPHYFVVAQVRANIANFGYQARTIVQQVTQTGVQHGTQMAHAQLQASVPRGYSYAFAQAHPSPLQLARQAQVYRLFDRYGDEAATAATDAIRQGVIAGRGPIVIARDIMASTDMSLSSALTISRTESMASLRDATLANYQANSDVVDAWVWLATDGCCAMCAAMQGQEFSTDESMDSHPNCRCAMVPKTKSWADIFAGTGIDVSDIPETTVQVPDGAEWFASKSDAYQRDILGNAKYNAYKAGGLTLADLVGTSHSSTWGRSRYEKSLKDLGLDASDYSD